MQTIEEKVNELINVIDQECKNMNLNATKVFLNGNCGNMFTIFANYFKKEAVIPFEILYKNYPYHIVSKIGNDFYDITGKTSVQNYVNYLRENNKHLTFNEKDFEIREITIKDREYRIKKQSDMYDCDMEGNKSWDIKNKMDRLYSIIDRHKINTR